MEEYSMYTTVTTGIRDGCVSQLAERRSLAGELTLSYARPVADG